jgi:hypothetical protein
MRKHRRKGWAEVANTARGATAKFARSGRFDATYEGQREAGRQKKGVGERRGIEGSAAGDVNGK